MFCDEEDVEARLRRELSEDEQEWLPGMIAEAQAVVIAYLGCPPDKYEDDVPEALTLVTSRMVARVIQEDETLSPETFGATQVSITASPYAQSATFAPGTRTGAPWWTKVDKAILDPYRCSGKAFSIDTAPRKGTHHAEGCSAINYDLPGGYWAAYCTCGADIAGEPIYGGGDEG